MSPNRGSAAEAAGSPQGRPGPTVTIDVDSVPGVGLGVARGLLTVQDMKDAAAAMWVKLGGPPMRILWDLEHAEFDLTTGQVRELAEHIKRVAPEGVRTAFVTDDDLQFGLIRMYETLRETPSARTAVFRDRESALEWLGVEPSA